MKPFARDFSMTSGGLIGLAVGLCALAGASGAQAQVACTPPATTTAASTPTIKVPATLPPDLVAEARAPHPFPTFCSIPPIPTDVRSAQGFKSAVDDIRLAKADLASQVADDRWSLTGTENFATGVRGEATPPPPMATGADTEAFLKAMKKRATPPPRPR